MSERHPEAEAVESEALIDRILGSHIRHETPVGHHDVSGHGRYADGTRGLLLTDLSIGSVIVLRHSCGGTDWTSEPLVLAGIQWSDVHAEHAIHLVGADDVVGWTHASSWGLEAMGEQYTTVDTDEASPTYMTEIKHPMCGRWSDTNWTERAAAPTPDPTMEQQ